MADITSLAEVFDFAKDYLGLLKAAVIASGIVPPGVEGGQSLADLLARLIKPGHGIGDWSARSTAFPGLAAGGVDQPAGVAYRGVHAPTGQAQSLTGQAVSEEERRRGARRSWASGWAARAVAGRTPAASGRG